jgi:hypothetical protein
MSDQHPQRAARSSRHRNPWVTALLILIGIILLLPGLCSLIVSAMFLTSGSPAGNLELGFLPLLSICFLIGVGGVALIVFAIRR